MARPRVDEARLKVNNSTPVRIAVGDRDDLVEIKGAVGKPICELIHEAVPLLRREYGIKSEDKGE